MSIANLTALFSTSHSSKHCAAAHCNRKAKSNPANRGALCRRHDKELKWACRKMVGVWVGGQVGWYEAEGRLWLGDE